MSSSEMNVITINNRQFVSGLMWEPLTRPHAVMSEAREIGKREGMDIVAIRRGLSMIQAGFVKKGNGITKGMYSLASALSGEIKEEAWIGAFALPNEKYALVAVHAGLIVPGCDVIGDFSEIRNLLLEKDGQPKMMKFDRVFHPVEFDHRGDPLDIEDVLVPSALNKNYALKQLTFGFTKHELMLIGGGLAVLAILVIGYMQYSAYHDREIAAKAVREELIRQQQLAELSAKSGAEQTVKALEHPWAPLPGVDDFLSGCQGAINSLPLAIGGWTIESALCNTTTLETVYGREGKTTFSDFIAATKGAFPSPPVLMQGGDRAGIGDQVKFGAGGDDEILPFDDLQALFTSHLQSLDLKAEIMEVPYVRPPAPQVLPGQTPPPLPPLPDWKKFTFDLNSQSTPKFIFSGLNLKGVRLTEIKVVRANSNLSWSMKGEIYAR